MNESILKINEKKKSVAFWIIILHYSTAMHTIAIQSFGRTCI
jgi:hypothetical protein